MQEWVKNFSLYVVIGMGLGSGIIITLKIWEKALDLILQMFNLQKEFIQYVYDKYHKRRVVTPKIQ